MEIEQTPGWDENDSHAFIDHGRIFVPDREEQIETLLSLIPPSARHVVELCCGEGALAGAVVDRFPGCVVHAYDRSPAMLEHARNKAAAQGLNVRCVEADARSFDLGTKYHFILLTGNAFQAFLKRQDQEALLASVRRHLAPNGIFAFETRNPSGHDLTDQPEEEFDQSYTSVEGHPVSVSFTQAYDPIAQVMFWTSYRRWNDGGRDRTNETHIACIDATITPPGCSQWEKVLRSVGA